MNRQHPTGPRGTPTDAAAFDRATRTLHREALDHVSPATLARLRYARREAASLQPRRRGGWSLAGACAAVVAVAVAASLQPGTPVEAPPAPLAEQPQTDMENAAVVALEENPDMYLWLAANNDAVPPSAEYRP